MGTIIIERTLGGGKGFSLIELLIAMSVLAISMLAAASMQYSVVRNNTQGNVSTQAGMLAKSQLEMLKNQDISSAVLAPGDYSDATPIDGNGNPGGIYKRSWRLDLLGTSARRIRVTVQWAKFGDPRSLVVRSNTKGSGL